MKKLVMFLSLLVVIVGLAVNSSYANPNGRNWALSPAVTAPLLSFQFAQIEGCGLDIRFKEISLSLFKVSHRSHEFSGLLKNGGVYTRTGTFLELNYRLLKTPNTAIGIGLNSLLLDNHSYLGYCLFAEGTLNDLAFVRISYRATQDTRAITINLGFNLSEAIREFYRQFLASD